MIKELIWRIRYTWHFCRIMGIGSVGYAWWTSREFVHPFGQRESVLEYGPEDMAIEEISNMGPDMDWSDSEDGQ